MTEIQLHPLCTLFPRMVGSEFAALIEDIKSNGLREPITLHDGMILDGGNRYRACLHAGVEPQFTRFSGSGLVSFVLSANLHRRHMTAGQQAAIVASAQDWAKAQTHGGDRKSLQVDTCPLETAADRAAQSGASEKTQRRADKVAKADPELAKAVGHGEVSLPKAVAQVEGKPSRAPKPKLLSADESARILAENARLQEIAETLAADAREATEDNASMAAVFEADDKLAAAMKEIERQKAEIRTLRERLNGKMNECVELNRLLRSCKAAREKLEKAAGK